VGLERHSTRSNIPTEEKKAFESNKKKKSAKRAWGIILCYTEARRRESSAGVVFEEFGKRITGEATKE